MREPRRGQFHMHLYHGTSASKLSSIMRQGLVDPYLTHDPELAEYYAGNEDDPAVLTVRANPRNLRVDWNSFDEPVHGYDGMERRGFDPSALRDRESDWKNSLKQTGAVSHRGTILPEDIIDVEEL